MKTFYLVRHGESEGNVGPFYQEFFPLTEVGREQALIVAKHAKKLPLDGVMGTGTIN